MDEYIQDDATYDFVEKPKGKVVKRGSKGNRAAQRKRYRERNVGKYREYMKRYMAEKRRKGYKHPLNFEDEI